MAFFGEACSSLTTEHSFTKSQNNTTNSSFLNVSAVVRQQSDTTHNNRRLTRSLALDDERPQTSASDLQVIK